MVDKDIVKAFDLLEQDILNELPGHSPGLVTDSKVFEFAWQSTKKF